MENALYKYLFIIYYYLNFIAGLAQWRGLAQTLNPCYWFVKTRKIMLMLWLRFVLGLIIFFTHIDFIFLCF